jgi:hypothetical protein
MTYYSLPVDGDTSTGPGVLAVIGGVFGTSLLLYLLRIYARLHPTRRLNSSDYVISLAVVSVLSTYSEEESAC